MRWSSSIPTFGRFRAKWLAYRAFPIFPIVMRFIMWDVETHPEKLESGVRKWFTYIALLIAAGSMIGDLITFLTYFLQGELTARFLLNVATVLITAGTVFWYCLGMLKRGSGHVEA